MAKSWLSIVAVLGMSGPALAVDPLGDWLVANKMAVVRVTPCGESFCGNLAWTKGPPGTDQNNPDPAKRSRSVIGMPILLDMKPTSNGNRWEGEIYNAEDGKIYSGSIALSNENVLRIEGCVLGFLCGGQNWSRAKCEEATGSATVGRSPTTGKKPPPPTPQTATAPPPLPSLTSCREAAP
jgi:uncharacterized protein (DUF2147 family)